ncbi:MAG: hypothetical protein U0165_12565 [Polyangiaceae bacterium]
MGQRSWLTDASIFSARVVFDEYISSTHEVIDYVTRYSGITAETIAAATLGVDEAREKIRSLIRPFDIICGHDLSNDLDLLGLRHSRVIDTVVLYPHHDGPPAKRSPIDSRSTCCTGRSR